MEEIVGDHEADCLGDLGGSCCAGVLGEGGVEDEEGEEEEEEGEVGCGDSK